MDGDMSCDVFIGERLYVSETDVDPTTAMNDVDEARSTRLVTRTTLDVLRGSTRRCKLRVRQLWALRVDLLA